MIEDDYQKKVSQELEAYNENINVHELPQIFHYWSNEYLLPMIQESGHHSIDDFFVKNLELSAKRTQLKHPIFLSVGAGNCDTEISIAKEFINRGFADFKIECLELNTKMLERGEAEAASHGLLDHFVFTPGDFNTWRASKQYAGIFANQSLHHVQNLEHLFSEIKDNLHAMGSFVISDMIGKNGHQRYPKALEIVHKHWRQLPVHQKYNHLLKRTEDLYENWDCSNEGFEGIRAQDILPLLQDTFICEIFVGFGNVVDIFIDRCFGHNFDPSSDKDKRFIDSLHAEDELGFKKGYLTPTKMLAVYTNMRHQDPYFSRDLSPEKILNTLKMQQNYN